MQIDKCRSCDFHVDALTDSVLCKYNDEVEYRVTDRGNVVMCPIDKKAKKGLFSFLKNKVNKN